MKKHEAKITIKHDNKNFIKSLYKALLPETLYPLQGCETRISHEETMITIAMICNRINLLRGLLNSYLSNVSMIMHVIYEGVNDVAAETSPRSATNTRTVSGA